MKKLLHKSNQLLQKATQRQTTHPTTVSTKVAIIDDEESVRNSIRMWLDHAEDFQCVGTWTTQLEASSEIVWKKPDVILVDLHLQHGTGIDALKAIKAGMPNIKIIMLTGEEDYYWIEQTLKAGADGYLLKSTIQERLAGAISEAMSGGLPLSGEISRALVKRELNPGASDGFSNLTPREKLVLHEMSEGMVYKEIASKHSISLETVRTHARRIFQKIQVNNRTEAVLAYVKSRS
ncbi:MAG: DNA-binding response regulator [Verrucomicrobiales bacterium]|nr:DNA-binding response regulator [Verrucomicrobiales bacterium]|tara:strand:- start:10200 stop:10904 length:705 start_codon:yes stop_codon:yes gene_type:complete